MEEHGLHSRVSERVLIVQALTYRSIAYVVISLISFVYCRVVFCLYPVCLYLVRALVTDDDGDLLVPSFNLLTVFTFAPIPHITQAVTATPYFIVQSLITHACFNMRTWRTADEEEEALTTMPIGRSVQELVFTRPSIPPFK